MRTLVAILLCFVAARVSAQAPAADARARFHAVDIYVDSGATPLAAYQIDLCVTNGAAKIVGIEGGESPAYHEPPYYDPKAMEHERVIIAAFSLMPAAGLPHGRTRVATVHFESRDATAPQFRVKLEAAADARGARIAAAPSLQETRNP